MVKRWLQYRQTTIIVEWQKIDIAAGSSGGDIVLYSMTTNQTVANFQVPNDHDSGLCFLFSFLSCIIFHFKSWKMLTLQQEFVISNIHLLVAIFWLLVVMMEVFVSYFSASFLIYLNILTWVDMWDTHSRRLHGTFPHQHGAPASSLVFSPVSRLLLVSCGLDKKIIFYDIPLFSFLVIIIFAVV